MVLTARGTELTVLLWGSGHPRPSLDDRKQHWRRRYYRSVESVLRAFWSRAEAQLHCQECNTQIRVLHNLMCIRGGIHIYMHQEGILPGFLTRTDSKCKIEEELTHLFKATSYGSEYLWMAVVKEIGGVLVQYEKFECSSLVFDVTVAVPLGPTTSTHSGLRARYALEKAMKANKTKCGSIYQ